MLRLRCLACGLLLPYKGSATDLCPRCLVSQRQAVSLIPVSDVPVSRATMGGLRVYTRVEGDRHTIFLSGELDMSTAPLMETAIAPALAMGGPVTLDLSDLAFIDSSGVGSIVRSLTALPSGCIVLHGVRSAAQRVIQIMGVDQASANLHVIPCAVPV